MTNTELFIWHKTKIAFNDAILTRGVVLSTRFEAKKKSTIWGHFWQMCFSFFQKTAPHQKLVVGENNVITDAYGAFEIWEENARHSGIEYNAKEASCWVISDLDDTALISHTKSTAKRIFTLLFYRPTRRKGVPFTTDFLQTMHAAGALTFYVSRSEENLFGLLHNALKHLQMPAGPMFLTHFKSWKTVANKSNKKGFKQKSIAKILQQSNAKPVVLLGDDSQEDLEIYTQIYQQFPHRILGIYIRQTLKTEKVYIRNRVNKLAKNAVPVTYFNSQFSGSKEAKNLIKAHLS